MWGSVSSVELTAIKLCVSSAVAIMFAMLFEGGTDDNNTTTGTDDEDMILSLGWLDAFHNLPTSIKYGVLGGSIPILIFQVNCTFLTHLTSSVAVGLVGQLKIIPQWITATIFTSDVHFRYLSSLNLAGAILTMASAAAFAVNEYCEHCARSAVCEDDQRSKIISSSEKLYIDGEDEDNATSSSESAEGGESSALLMGDVAHNDGRLRYGSIDAKKTAKRDDCRALDV